MGEVADKKRGLAGVVAGESTISLCGSAEDHLLYRGYPVEELAEKATFEEVVWLLLRGELPTYKELEGYRETLARESRDSSQPQGGAGAGTPQRQYDGSITHRLLGIGPFRA